MRFALADNGPRQFGVLSAGIIVTNRPQGAGND
jgi:hypothetical protein